MQLQGHNLKRSRLLSASGRIMAPNDVHVLNAATCVLYGMAKGSEGYSGI